MRSMDCMDCMKQVVLRIWDMTCNPPPLPVSHESLPNVCILCVGACCLARPGNRNSSIIMSEVRDHGDPALPWHVLIGPL